MPSGVPAVFAGLKYGLLNAFNNSARNSKETSLWIRKRFDAPMSKRYSGGPLTTRLRTPQSPALGNVWIQSAPFAGARYRPVGTPSALFLVAEVAPTENALTVFCRMSS